METTTLFDPAWPIVMLVDHDDGVGGFWSVDAVHPGGDVTTELAGYRHWHKLDASCVWIPATVVEHDWSVGDKVSGSYTIGARFEPGTNEHSWIIARLMARELDGAEKANLTPEEKAWFEAHIGR